MLLHHAQYGVQKTAGYTMLFAVLVSSILLSIGIFILNVSKKEVILSAIARESAIAFYAADGGVECAHFWNAQTNSPLGVTSAGVPNGGTVSCGGLGSIPVTIVPPTQSNLKSVATLSINVPSLSTYPGFCAEIKVTKNYTYSAGTPLTETSPEIPAAYNLLSTIIESRGYNTCVTTDPRRVERGLRETLQ